MTSNKPISLCYATFPSLEEAKRVGRLIIKQKLAACVNIIPQIHSIYEWQKDICEETEVVMLIKTGADSFDSLKALFQKEHPYDEPCLLEMKDVNAIEGFSRWVYGQLK